MLNRLKYNYLKISSRIESRHIKSVNLWGVAFLFAIILAGIILGIIILSLEKLYFFYSNKWEINNEQESIYAEDH